MSSTLEIGKQLVDLFNKGKVLECVDKFYAKDIVSVEAEEHPGHPRTTNGVAGIRAKNEWWLKAHEVHSSVAKGPWPHDDRFIVTFKIDVTPNEGPMKGKRFTMEEAGVYTVKDGKIVKEEFFYSMGG